MPNWCDGRLEVSGPAKELKRFQKFARGMDPIGGREEELSAHNFIPYPREELEHRIQEEENAKPITDRVLSRMKGQGFKKDHYNAGGYEWCIDNWGSKWGFCAVEPPEKSANMVVYSFQTAWSPVVSVVKKMAEMFPKLKFSYEYEEEGNGIKGEVGYEQGQEIYAQEQ